MRKFPSNAYEIELLKDFVISPIFNVFYLYPFKEQMDDSTDAHVHDKFWWEKQRPSSPAKQIESIIDQRVAKRTRKKEYLQYLVKCKNQPVEDAT